MAWYIWGGALALYVAFRLWYDSWRGPLTKAEIDAFFDEATDSDYDNALATCQRWFDCH